MTNVINMELKNEIQREWGVPEVSKATMRLYGWSNPFLMRLKEVEAPKSGDIKTSIDAVLKGPLKEAKDASDAEITNLVWSDKLADGTTTNTNHDASKTEKGVRDWNHVLTDVIAYLNKKL